MQVSWPVLGHKFLGLCSAALQLFRAFLMVYTHLLSVDSGLYAG